MLDDYKQLQPNLYKIVTKTIVTNHYSHAYLIEAPITIDSKKIILSVVKSFLCPQHATNFFLCGNCKICQRIDDNNYSELMSIDCLTDNIKKQTIIDLKNIFSQKIIEGNKKICVIYNCHMLNTQSGNSLLKFIEEPENDVIIILVTDNINQVLKTIVSRCMIIKLKNNLLLSVNPSEHSAVQHLSHILAADGQANLDQLPKEDNQIFLDKIMEFIKTYEKIKLDVLLDINNLWFNYIEGKEKTVLAFELMILFYKDVLNKMILGEVSIFNDYDETIKNIQVTNNCTSIINKIKILLNLKNMILYNVNSNLLIDQLVIQWKESDDRCSQLLV